MRTVADNRGAAGRRLAQAPLHWLQQGYFCGKDKTFLNLFDYGVCSWKRQQKHRLIFSFFFKKELCASIIIIKEKKILKSTRTQKSNKASKRIKHIVILLFLKGCRMSLWMCVCVCTVGEKEHTAYKHPTRR